MWLISDQDLYRYNPYLQTLKREDENEKRSEFSMSLGCLSMSSKKIKKTDLQSFEMCQSISVPVIPDLKDSTSLLFY